LLGVDGVDNNKKGKKPKKKHSKKVSFMISPSHDKLGVNIDIEDLSKSAKSKSRKVKKNM
jgi:hypothetical protein